MGTTTALVFYAWYAMVAGRTVPKSQRPSDRELNIDLRRTHAYHASTPELRMAIPVRHWATHMSYLVNEPLDSFIGPVWSGFRIVLFVLESVGGINFT